MNRRRLLHLELVLVGVVTLAACSPAEVAEQPATDPVVVTDPVPTTMGTAPTTVAVETTAAAAGPAEFGPKAVSLEWGNCFETQGAQLGDLTFSCSTRHLIDVPEFSGANFNGYVNFFTNDQDEVVSVAIRAGGYNGSCFWNPEEGVEWESPLQDGTAVIEGVLIGTDLCDGYQLGFTATWDQESLEFMMDGMVEPVG